MAPAGSGGGGGGGGGAQILLLRGDKGREVGKYSYSKLCFNYLQHAKECLKCFFVALKYFYGPASQIMNPHNLLHLPDDVQNMDCSLSEITAFPFENILGKIKRRLLRTSYTPLAQVCRRRHEESSRNKCRKATMPPFNVIMSPVDTLKILSKRI